MLPPRLSGTQRIHRRKSSTGRKPGQAFFVFGEVFGQSLDSDFAPELLITGTPHLSHAPLAEGGEHFIVCQL